MASLPLLQDGSCGLQNSCLSTPSSVHAQCPQSFKCGTCVAWSPREKNRFTRNSGQCLLDRSATQFLDCNAPICPYYRPRADTPAFDDWNARPTDKGADVVARRTQIKSRTRKMTREAPPPSVDALAHAAFRDHDADVAGVGVVVLAGQLHGVEPVPALLERFRGGSARVKSAVDVREVAIEGLWARLALLRRSIARLDGALASSSLDPATKEKVERDLAGIAGSMTTFNLLFAKREDAFKGASSAGGKGE
ncbi:MAG: hypothetical protein Q8O67_26240 [Deltaproteobacteria bacterium]|nr:hypothetical protein [Deltaproteobacteria bacterium]